MRQVSKGIRRHRYSTVVSIRFLLISIRFRDFVGFPESQCAVKISKKFNTESNREKKRRRKAVM